MVGFNILWRTAKSRARSCLYSNYLLCAGVSAVLTGGTYLSYALLSVLIPGGLWNFNVPFSEVTPLHSSLSTLSSYLMLLFFVPLQLGTASVYMALVYGERPSFGSIFTWYRSSRLFLRAMAVYLLYLLFGIAAVLAWIVPPMLLAGLASFAEGIGLSVLGILLAVSALLTFCVCGILVLMLLLSYAPAVYILARSPELGIRGVLRMRRARMRGRMWEPFRIALRFTGWYLLFFALSGVSTTLFLQFKNLYFAGTPDPLFLVTSLLILLMSLLLLVLYVSPLFSLSFSTYTAHLLSLPDGNPAGYAANARPRRPSAEEPE